MKTNKKLLILGGSRRSIEIVNQARKQGIYTVVTDWYPIEKSPAKRVADKSYQISTTDLDALERLVKEEKIDGILTGYTDSTLPHYAKLCERVGLPCYGSSDLFEIFINKDKYKEKCRKFDVPVIEEFKYSLEELRKMDQTDLETLLPLLIKPADNSGGRGITICRTVDQIEEGYNTALEYSESKVVLLEKYVEGKEVTVFFLFDEGDIYLSGVGNRHVKYNQGKDTIPLPVGYTFPSNIIPGYLEDIFPKIKKMLKSLDVKNGIMFAQCIIEENNCYIYDIGYRLTGSLEYKLQEAICGFNPLAMLINFAVTGTMSDGSRNLSEIVTPYWKKYAYNVSLLVKAGKTIHRIEGLSEIKKYPGVIDVELSHVVGDTIPESSKGTLNQICMRVFGASSKAESLTNDMINIRRMFKAFDEQENDITLSGIEKLDVEGRLPINV